MSSIAPLAPALPAAPLGGNVPPPALPNLPAAPSYNADALSTSGVYVPQTPYNAYPQQPDVFDGMRDLSQGVARGVGVVGREVVGALPAVGQTLADGGEVVGRAVYAGGKEVAGVLPAAGRGVFGALKWLGSTFMAAGRWLFGVQAPPPAWNPQPMPGVRPPAVLVEPGDTLRSIATTFLGDGARWKEIYQLNKGQLDAAGGLRVGMVLVLPQNDPAPAPITPPKPDKPVARRHTVVRGDTLWTLAERFYGDASRWRDIQDANPGKAANPRKLIPGQVLRIP